MRINKVSSSIPAIDVKLLECVNPVRGLWRIRWDIRQIEGNNHVEYMEAEVAHKPRLEEIREMIYEWIDRQTDAAILQGFVWRDHPVWLSRENQMNFKAAYDLAVQTGGATLPVKFKMCEDENGNAVYHEFNELSEFTDFYTSAVAYVNATLQKGWAKKDGINWQAYWGEEVNHE